MNKKELLRELLAGEGAHKERYVFIIENRRIVESVGFFKLEVLQDKKVIFRFKIQIDNKNVNLARLKDGETQVTVGFLDLTSKSIFEKIKEGITSKVESGEIPFLPN